MQEKQKFHGIAVEKSNSVIYHTPSTRHFQGAHTRSGICTKTARAQRAFEQNAATIRVIGKYSPASGALVHPLYNHMASRKIYIVRHRVYSLKPTCVTNLPSPNY